MNTYNVRDRVQLGYTFQTGSPPALTDPDKVIFTLNPGAVSYTWLRLGGGDPQIVRDSIGTLHVQIPIQNYGLHDYNWQSFVTAVDATNPVEDESGQFFAGP